VFLSAYPLAFLEALASETIPPLRDLRMTSYSDFRPSEGILRGYFVPIFRYCDKLRFLLSTELLLDACISFTGQGIPFLHVRLNAAYQPI
jgi:hypothetical protein